MGRGVACMAARRAAYRLWVGKPDGKRLHGKPRRRWEDILKRVFKKCNLESRSGFIWFRIETAGRLL
jgi:hypothetical protein